MQVENAAMTDRRTDERTNIKTNRQTNTCVNRHTEHKFCNLIRKLKIK